MTPLGAINTAQIIAQNVLELPPVEERSLIAIAGPPASGKSTVAEALCRYLNDNGCPTGFVPMDGFHMDNEALRGLGLLERKGAPQTFDLPGFAAKIRSLKSNGDVSVPLFDRAEDRVLPDAAEVRADQRHVVLEGNYLLFDAPGWRDLSAHWAYSVFLELDLGELNARLLERWREHGLSEAEAAAKAQTNDLPNAEAVLTNRVPSDLTLFG